MMLTRQRVSVGVVATAAFFLGACASSTEAPQPASITVVSGSGQTGFGGLTLAQGLVVKVTDANGAALSRQIVDFAVTSGQGTVSPATDTTGVDGTATTDLTLGSSSTSVQVTATVRSTSLNALFTETVQQLSGNVTCTSANTLTLASGEVRTAVSGTGLCLQGPASSTSGYMVHAIFESTVPSAQTQVGVTAFGVTGFAPNANRVPTALRSLSPTGLAIPRAHHDPAGYLAPRFRELEQTLLRSRLSAARAAWRTRALRAAAVPAIGDMLQLNTSEGCNDTPHFRTGRVVAITNKAIVVADTGNPAGGFSDADYQSVGVTFDTLVTAVDEPAFGTPTDIDGNGHIIIFYTRAVNELTAPGSTGVIEGFFNPRDLFPKTASDPRNACSSSNFAEMFYVVVPDPNKTINGFETNADTLKVQTPAVIGHEYQHLINGSRRAYITDATDFEEVWLNEGMSHIAEELLYYKSSGLTPRQNIDATSVRSSSARVAAVNHYQLENLFRYSSFLDTPMTTSPYADNDSLATRGATWGLLRYLADHHAATDGTVWSQLVDSPSTGMTNLAGVFGTPILDQIRDWAISVFTDDLATTSTPYQGLSWNFRAILPLVQATAAPVSIALSNGVQSTQALVGGGSMYTTFTLPANGTGAVSWTVSSPNVVISVVRTR